MIELLAAVAVLAAVFAVVMAVSATRSRRSAERLRDEWLAKREVEYQDVLREYAARIEGRTTDK